ncbi:hypothetical protein J5N97_006601 [Dioscorea zingiberensis]|uniref:Disease resistance protein RPM1-like n=1 Tax=Dioscorea zingiberensis TaxID=325984 RepID=A0A9D5HSW3_9LILI|nr:hypothetical protein J5N97_006601 [Dioscorea zingiberensis]
MAESSVSFLISKMDYVLTKEARLLRGVRREVQDIRDELESMRAFLREADAREQRDLGLKSWIKQVREVAFDVEDILDEFEVRIAEPRKRGIASFFKNLITRHRIANQILDIKSRVRIISERRVNYGFGETEHGSSGLFDAAIHHHRIGALFMEEDELVGVGDSRETLSKWLTEGEVSRVTHSVVGMGGSGKTSIVKKVYDSKMVQAHFECHAWITVSQNFKIGDVLRSLIRQFNEQGIGGMDEEVETFEVTKLIEMLRGRLREKRYIVIFDDVWSFEFWETIKYALIDSRNGSRVMITTRNSVVASSCVETLSDVYHLQPLPWKEAWFLFSKKAFENGCPEELKLLSESIVQRCGGLPLAIVAIAGLLSVRPKTLIEWKKVEDSLGSELENNPGLQGMKDILMLSYQDLPYYLKPCFLYFSVFPEDYSIKCMKLIRLWMAEGFLKSNQGLTMEEVGEDYLRELIDRNMVQVTNVDVGGRARRCQVHDFLHEIILSRSAEENFFASFAEHTPQSNCKIRRLAISNETQNSMVKNSNLSQLRSLFIYKPNKSSTIMEAQALISSFRLLRILDLKAAPIDRFPVELANLLNMRYLSLRNTRIKTVPKSIGRLKNLLTLDLKDTLIDHLPEEILNLQQLRHLLVYRYDMSNTSFDYIFGVKVPDGIGILKALQKVCFVRADRGKEVIKELSNLTQLRRLGVIKVKKEDGVDLCSSIEKMHDLRAFSVSSRDEEELLNLDSLFFPPPLLQCIYLDGPMEKFPLWLSSLHNLSSLHLKWSMFRDDPLQFLQDLPNLLQLELHKAYEGTQLHFKPKRFPRLKKLYLTQLDSLNFVIIDQDAMAKLEKMYIGRCRGLLAAPSGIEELSSLNGLYLYDMPENFVKRVTSEDGKDRSRVEHIPTIRSYYSAN